jgi:hypothetical protein
MVILNIIYNDTCGVVLLKLSVLITLVYFYIMVYVCNFDVDICGYFSVFS